MIRAIEAIARRSHLTEHEVADRATRLAGWAEDLGADASVKVEGEPAPRTDVGFFLVGERRGELEEALATRIDAPTLLEVPLAR